MTLDLAIDIRHVETLHHFFVLLLRAGGDPGLDDGCRANYVLCVFCLFSNVLLLHFCVAMVLVKKKLIKKGFLVTVNCCEWQTVQKT